MFLDYQHTVLPCVGNISWITLSLFHCKQGKTSVESFKSHTEYEFLLKVIKHNKACVLTITFCLMLVYAQKLLKHVKLSYDFVLKALDG